MAGCALTQDYVLDCRDAIGGIKTVYLMEVGNLTSYTQVSGVVTAIVKATGKFFRKYALIRDTSHTTETLTVSEQNGTVFSAQSVEIILNKMQANTRNEIMLLAANNLVMVAVTNQGKNFIYGIENGLVLGAGVAGSGTAWGDRNGYTLPFAGNEKQLAYEVDATTLLTLQTPG